MNESVDEGGMARFGTRLWDQDFSTRPNIILGPKGLPVGPFCLLTSLGSSACFLLPAFWQHLVIFDVTLFLHSSDIFVHFPVFGIQVLPSLFSGFWYGPGLLISGAVNTQFPLFLLFLCRLWMSDCYLFHWTPVSPYPAPTEELPVWPHWKPYGL